MAQLASETMAVVRTQGASPSLSVQVQVGGKMRNLDRPKDEMVEKPLMRLQKTACQKPKSGKKKSKDGHIAASVPPPAVSLYGGPDELFPLLDPGTTSNEMAWKDGYMLKIGDAKYDIVVDPPFVERLQVHGNVFAGVPAVPFVETTDTDSTEWQWYRLCAETDEWVPTQATTRSFVPMQEDVGNKLMVSCTPVQRRINAITNEKYDLKGFTSSIVVGPVVAAPEFAAASRLPDTKGASIPNEPIASHESAASWTAHPDFRVMTYNILADQYASTDRAKDVLFAHCPNECLESQYRRPLVFKEILDYKPDVVCLQEVDESAFLMLLRPGLREFGMEGVYTNKAGRVKEGSATFWRAERFRMVDSDEMEMRKYFPKDASKKSIDAAPLGPELRPMFESSPALCEALQKVGTIAQLTLLAPTGPVSKWGNARPLCVVNTHLFFHYAAPHIRTIHVWAMLHRAKEFIDGCMADSRKSEELGHRTPSLVFCGDLNSDINDGIPGTVRLLESGAVDKHYWDWKFGKDFAWGNAARGENDGGDGDEGDADDVGTGAADILPRSDSAAASIIAGMDLASPFALRSADGMEPEFTNYVRGYQGLLDYVWYDRDHIRVKGTAPIPTKDQLGGYLPSPRYPSDHLAVVADLTFIGEGERDEDDVDPIDRIDRIDGVHGPRVANLPAVYKNVSHAESALLQEQVIAVPTDTIYGIAAIASSSKAINAIYDIKRRDHSKPLAVCVADHHDISHICHTAHLPEGLLNSLLPGPVTVVLDRKNDSVQISDALNPGVDALAIRIPDFPFLRAICRQVQTPLALTSANISGDKSPVHTSEFGHIAENCAIVFDHGTLGQRTDLSDALQRAGSTIVDLRATGTFKIVREGSALEETVALLVKKGLRLLKEEG